MGQRQPSKKLLLKRSITTNDYIRADKLRVLDDQNSFIGILSRNEALQKAREVGLDLVEIAPKAVPPVAKIINFNKYLYQLAKRDKSGDKKGKTETKELKIGLFMAENDLLRFASRASEFLKAGNQVRISLWLKGREIMKKDLAIEVIKRFTERVEKAKITSGPMLQGKVMRLVITLDKSKHEEKKN